MASRTPFSTDAVTVCFGERLARSRAFLILFDEGMALVEEAAAYLDGEGRKEAKALGREAALAYATESMRLTTRLMQLASWLLLQRAVNQGEMTRLEAASEKHKVKLCRQGQSASGETFDALPHRLREMIAQSLRLQERVLRLDAAIYAAPAPSSTVVPLAATPVESQLQALRQAFRLN